MKTLFTNILSVCLNKKVCRHPGECGFRQNDGLVRRARNSLFLILLLPFLVQGLVWCFQTDLPGQTHATPTGRHPIDLIEAGLVTKKNSSLSIYHLFKGNYKEALAALNEEDRRIMPWLETYLEGLVQVSSKLILFESDYFDFWVPPDQAFLKEYALSVLDEIGKKWEKIFGHRPQGKIRVEIYPTKEDFSLASTLGMETLKRSGAIGICKFHRLMIVSPRALPLGYRWLDALAHEYTHLMVNELTGAHAELWLHEGTARYFDTLFRSNPPTFLTPNQKTNLLEAMEEDRLIPFKRMSPSLVYLKDQEEVSLAFSQVSYSVQTLIKQKGQKNFVKFLKSLRKKTFQKAFQDGYGLTTAQFEEKIKHSLSKEKWRKTKGAMTDDVVFDSFNENDYIGANVKGKIRLGDRMRMKKRFQAALIEYKKALQEEPENAVILLKVARTYLELKEKEKAIRYLRHAVKSNPNYGTPHIELARWVEPKESLELLKTANAINPFNPLVHALMEQAYQALGDTTEAKREGDISRQLRFR